MWPKIETWLLGTLQAPMYDEYAFTTEVAAMAQHRIRDTRRPAWSLVKDCEANIDLALDILDVVLHIAGDHDRLLEDFLQRHGSVWAVSPEGDALVRRVGPATTDSYRVVTSPHEEASAELVEAWSKAYGRDPDPSDAWDHSIKALEAALQPIVCPKNDKATLGTMIRDLSSKPEKWTFGLNNSGSTIGGVEILIEMLRLVWPNPDRHAGGSNRRQPDLAEAQAVLQVAINVVHLVRLGIVK